MTDPLRWRPLTADEEQALRALAPGRTVVALQRDRARICWPGTRCSIGDSPATRSPLDDPS